MAALSKDGGEKVVGRRGGCGVELTEIGATAHLIDSINGGGRRGAVGFAYRQLRIHQQRIGPAGDGNVGALERTGGLNGEFVADEAVPACAQVVGGDFLAALVPPLGDDKIAAAVAGLETVVEFLGDIIERLPATVLRVEDCRIAVGVECGGIPGHGAHGEDVGIAMLRGSRPRADRS